MANFNEEDRQWLYDTMKSKGIDTGSYDDFKSSLDNDEDRQWYYDKGKELGLDLGTKQEFDDMMWERKTPAQTQAPAAPASTDTTQANYTFTEAELGEGGDITNKVPANQPQVPAKYGTPEYAQEVINDDLEVENPYRGMTRQQAINAIGEKYRNEWYGKPGAYQNIQKELAAYNIASPEDYGHITAAVRNHYVDSVARQRAEDILSKFGHVNGMTLDDIQGIMDSRETQQAIESDMKHLGIQSAEDAYDEFDTEGRLKAREEYEKEKEAYYQNFNKQLQQVLVDKYGYLPTSDGRSHATSIANSLFDGSVGGHEERIRKREALDMMQDYVEGDINETFKKYDEEAQKEFEKASERALKNYNTAGTSPTGTASIAGSSIGQALYAQHAKESARDYDKIIKDISDRSASIFKKMTNNDGFLKEAMKNAEALGISPEEYMANYVVPGFMDAIQRQFAKTAIAREMPKGKLDYIMRGLEDSVVGMLISSAINPKSKIAYRDMANAKYGEDAGMWLEGARMAVGMASDFWLWGGWGKIGASATKSLLNMRIMNLAAARGISREAATRMVEEEAKKYLSKRVFNQLMSHMPSSMVTMGGAQASTELVRGTTRGEDDVLLNTVKTGLSSAATGAAFGATGAVSGSITSKLAGWKRLLGKVAGLEVEAGTLYTTEELQKMMAGEDAFQNPYEGMLEANVKLGFIKASANPIESARKLWNAVMHPVKTVKGMAKPDLSTLDEKDVKHIMESVGGKDLLDALTSMRPQLTKENAEREGNLTEEEVLKAAEAYKNFMADADVPWDTKQKVARLHGAIVPPAGYEVSTEIKEGENGETLLITRDMDGQCIRELHFDNPEDAEWERNKINGNTYLNRVSALQERIDAYDAQKYYSQYLTNEYAKIAEKMQQEDISADDLTPDERQCIYLYQHANELQTARDKMMDGQELTPAEKQLVDIYQKRFIGYTLEGHGHEAFDRQFEREEGLEEGIMDKIDLTEHKSLLLEYSDAMEQYLAEKDKAAETTEDSAPMLEQTPRQLEGNAGGEAGGVQSTGANEPSATLEVDESPAQEAPAAEAAPVERNERRQAAYEIGKQAVVGQANLADISYDSQLASLRMQQLFPENDPILSHLRKDIFKALADGNHAEVDRLMDANAGYINARQREAIEQYRDAVEASAGISDGIRQELAQYETQHREMLQEITAQDGNITELALADGSTAYYMSGDLNGQSVMVKNQNGEVIQISTNSISAIGEVRKMEDVLAADIEANQQTVLSTLSSYANGSNFVVGQQVDLSIAGKPFHGMMAGYSPDGSYIFQMEDGSEIPMTPQDAQQAVMEANRQKMEAQLRQEKADAVAEQQAERFGKSISGYAEGKPDLTAKDTDPKAAAEYLMKDSEDGNHAPVLSSIESEIARLNEDKTGNLEVVKALTNKEAMGELTEKEAVSLADARRAIEDADARRRKWGEIRQELMDDNERAKLESARQSDIKNALAATKKDYQVNSISIGEEVPTSEALMERFEEKGDAADHIEKMMTATKAYYRDNLFPQLSQVRDTIRDYRRGLVDLTKDELADLTRKLVDLESEETYLVNKQQNLSMVYNSLGRLYAQREVANLTPHERKMRQLEKETDREKKLKLAKEAYADDEDALAVLNDTEPQDIYEFVSSNIGAGSINWEGMQRGEHYVRGLRDELGTDKKRGIGKDSDTFGFNYFLAPEGQGKGIEEIVHGIAEGSPYSTEDVRNALIDMLTSASKPTDISHRIVDDRIARAEDIYNANLEREREAEEESQSEAQIKAEDAAIMEMTGMTPEEYDAFISDLEDRLAAQEGYKTSDEYFNHLTDEYDRQNEGSVGGSQESGTPKEQGKAVEQAGAEAAGETSVADVDAVTKVNKALEPIINKYNSLAPIEVVSIDSDEMLAKVYEQMTGEKPSNEDLEEMRQDIKSSKLPAAYDERSKKIYIFAENFPSDKAEEGFFHENLHRGLHQYYGDGLREVAEEYWNNSTSEQAEANKQRISEHYADQPEKIKEEYLVHTMAVNMVVGRVDKLITRLGEENQEIIKNILKNIGYDRTKEAAGRAAQAGETLEEADQKGLEANRAEGRVRDNQAQKPERPAEDTTKGEDLMDVPFTERLKAAKGETNTNPTEEQKKAGNYKLGHIRFGGYEMSIENPKGSTRSGVDANGKPWSITMHDTYGYIREKYGADGDHLDFFINDDADLDKWDGFVFIVDQKNEDGSFDEHKVMYGYPNLRTAKEAYLRNYEDGWEDKHVMGIMGARKADFDKWLADSDHKHKPFAEYFRTKNNNNTIKDNVDQLLADVTDRKQKYEKQTKPSYTETQLAKMTKSELVNLKAKRKKDFKTNRYLLSSTDVAGSGSAKELQIRNNMAQANADMEAIDAELKRKEVADKERIEQMEMGFAMTDRLEDMGVDVITDPSEIRRGRKNAERDNSEAGKLRHFKTTSGEIYGFSYKDKLYIDIRKINSELPMHEYGHLWAESLRKINPENWKSVVDLMKGDKDTWEFIKSLNPDLTSEDDIAEEMIAKCSGKRGVARVRKEYERMNGRDPQWKSKWGAIWQNIAKAIQDFWKKVGDYLNIKYESADQVYDQVIRDFANKVNPRKKIEKWLQERDKAYLDAVKAGDKDKAKELFDAALRENIGNGIVPFVAVDGYRGKLQKLAHGVKDRDPKVIAEVADLMTPIIPKDAVLVPAPSHTGEATDMLDLAKAISERTGAPVADVLKSAERGSQYEAKYAGKPISSKDMGITMQGELPEGKIPVVIDNVVDTGNTAEACVQALGKGIVASLADSADHYKHVASLKSAEPVVVDKNGKAVPLSQRFEIGGKYLDKAVAYEDIQFDIANDGAAIVSMKRPDSNGYDLNDPLQQKVARLKEEAGPNSIVGYVDSSNGDYVVIGNDVNTFNQIIGSRTYSVDANTVRIPANKFDIVSPKVVREGYKMAFANDEIDETAKLLTEVDRRKELASQKESEQRVKEYLDKKVKGDEAQARQRATKAVLKAMDKAGVPYKVVSKEEEREMMQIFSMMNQESVKAFCRRADIRSTSRHGFGRYCVYNMADPFAVPMYHEKLSYAKEDLEQLQRMAPKGAWEILDIGYADEAQDDKNLTGKAADMNLAELQADIETWHGSGAVFTRFDHSHMGEGANSQVFGWGTYLSTGRKVAEGYTQLPGDIRYSHLGEDISKKDTVMMMAAEIMTDPTIKNSRDAEKLANRFRDKVVPGNEERLKLWDEVIEVLRNSQKADFEVNERTPTLYKVDIPDDTGENYLDWMKTIEKPLRRKIADAVRNLKGEPEPSVVYANYKDGWNTLANIIERDQLAYKEICDRLEQAFGGRNNAAEKVSKLMSSIGFVGVKYPAGTIMGGGNGATNYVIFNEDDAKIVDTIQFMMGDAQKEDKRIMGWSDGKQVYLTEAGLNPNTPLHETTHLWDKWCQKENPELWQKLVDAMKKTAMWEEISKNPNYRNIWNDDSRMASEVHARLSGAKGEDEFMKAAFKKDTPQSIIDEVKSVLKKFWESILRLFGKTTKTIGDEWSSLDAIIRMPLRDLLNQDFEKVMKVAEGESDAHVEGHIVEDKDEIARLDAEPKEAKKYTSESGRIKANAEREGNFMMAPDGTHTKLSEKEWIAARTADFKKWMGFDWENIDNGHMVDESQKAKLDKNGEPLEKYVQGYMERPRKPGKPKKKESETMAEYFNRLRLWEQAVKDWPETEAQWKAIVYRHDGSALPDETAINEKWMQKYEEDLAKWKVDNALPADAEAPTEKPVGDDADPLEYMRTMADWRRSEALWKTAPDKRDYEREAEAEVYSMLAQLELRHHPMSYSARMKQAGASLSQLRHAVLTQKRYDKTTVQSVVDFAKNFMSMGFGDNIGRGDLESILTSVKRAVGARSIKDSVDDIMNKLVENHLRNLSNYLEKLTSIKDKRLNPTGVEVQGELDLEGQRAIAEFRRVRAARMTPQDINTRLDELASKIMNDPENRSQWEAEFDGARAALIYMEGVAANKKACADAENAIRDAEREYKNSGRSYAAQQELLESLHKGLTDLLFERIDLYGQLFGELGALLGDSRERAHDFRENEKLRVFNIHRMAAIDMAGKDANEIHPAGFKQALNNSALVRLPLCTLGTFEQMLKQFASRTPNGEGMLYNHFMRGFVDATNKEEEGLEAAKGMLDAKVSEVYGRKMQWSDLYLKERFMPTLDVTWRDGEGNQHTYTLSQGNMLAIYMWNKMHDGQMKLRKMDIVDSDVNRIAERIDPKLITLADWIQEEFLPTLRSKYNKVHEQEFGAAMAEIENYFPLRIVKDSIQREEDLTADPNADSVLPSTTTGSIIKRTVNAKPLDILNTDALSLVIEHIEEMEKWAAFTHWNKDVNTLLSYNRFKNQVKNMDTIYGSGEELWDAFRAACQMAAGTYRASHVKADKAMTVLAAGVTGAKIAFRPYTALKQLLSAPAFLSDANAENYAKYFMNPKNFFYENFKWGMENLPILRKRWHSRDMGDTRLSDKTGFGYWHTQTRKWVAQYGMWANGMIDVLTCAAGARAVYETRLANYKKLGYNEAEAKEKALQDAAIAYNLTQQSSEGAFVSQIQKDRTLFANMWTVFRNSPAAYTRQSVDAIRNLKRLYSNREDMLRLMEMQFKEDGFAEAQAKSNARAEYKRAIWKNMAKLAVCALILPWFWELGSKVPYLIFGDDDELKKRMLGDVTRKELISGPTEGLTFGSATTTLIGAVTDHEVTEDLSAGNMIKAASDVDLQPLPMFGDMATMMQKFGYDGAAGLQDLVNIACQIGTGVNPKTLTDPIVAAIDACRGDMTKAKEIELFLMRVVMVPNESAQNIYLDEIGMDAKSAKSLSYDELAERYADYQFGKNTPMFGWVYSDEAEKKRRESYLKRFDKEMQDRIHLKDDKALQKEYDGSTSLKERKMVGKEVASRHDSDDNYSKNYNTTEETKKARNYYVTNRSWNDLMEDLELERLNREAKAKGNEDVLETISDAKKDLNDLIKDLPTDKEGWQHLRDWRKEVLDKLKTKK